MSTLRYVILRHDGIEQPHFDLMFETSPGSPLATWRSSQWPIRDSISVEKLADHRQDYLTYEGAVSGDRGSVRRVEAGEFEVRDLGDDQWLIDLGKRPLRFVRIADRAWRCDCVNAV